MKNSIRTRTTHGRTIILPWFICLIMLLGVWPADAQEEEPSWVDLMNRSVIAFLDDKQYDEAIEAARQALQKAEETFGPETSEVAETLQLPTRRKRSLAAQEALILLTDLPHNVLSWLHHGVCSQTPFADFGTYCIVHELLCISGTAEFMEGRLQKVALLTPPHMLNPSVRLSKNYSMSLAFPGSQESISRNDSGL